MSQKGSDLGTKRFESEGRECEGDMVEEMAEGGCGNPLSRTDSVIAVNGTLHRH